MHSNHESSLMCTRYYSYFTIKHIAVILVHLVYNSNAVWLQVNFSRIGTQCLGEEHQRVIKQQKEALAQLRAKLKQLEEAKPPGLVV